jgi:hypothetical protein
MKIQHSTLEFTSLGWSLFHFMDSFLEQNSSGILTIHIHTLQSLFQDYFIKTRLWKILLFSTVVSRYKLSSTACLWNRISRGKCTWETLHSVCLFHRITVHISILRNQRKLPLNILALFSIKHIYFNFFIVVLGGGIL